MASGEENVGSSGGLRDAPAATACGEGRVRYKGHMVAEHLGVFQEHLRATWLGPAPPSRPVATGQDNVALFFPARL